jgi:2-polyprenyl-3-methyl-5-hydroxy-6-metoxy-1,4-benzoquinol methylase
VIHGLAVLLWCIGNPELYMTEVNCNQSNGGDKAGSINTGFDYSQKPAGYFGGARKSFVDALPPNPKARLLEIGCGSGETAAYALAQGKCGWSCGVELCQGPAERARDKLHHVIVGDVERIDLDFPDHHFDVLLMSEVLEHLVNPWEVLRRFHRMLKPEAIVIAGSPNICHYLVILSLLRGKWCYEKRGVFDATHLRWFSPSAYRQMFEDCNYTVDEVGPARRLNVKARFFNMLTLGRFEYLLHSQIVLRGRRSLCD